MTAYATLTTYSPRRTACKVFTFKERPLQHKDSYLNVTMLRQQHKVGMVGKNKLKRVFRVM